MLPHQSLTYLGRGSRRKKHTIKWSQTDWAKVYVIQQYSLFWVLSIGCCTGRLWLCYYLHGWFALVAAWFNACTFKNEGRYFAVIYIAAWMHVSLVAMLTTGFLNYSVTYLFLCLLGSMNDNQSSNAGQTKEARAQRMSGEANLFSQPTICSTRQHDQAPQQLAETMCETRRHHSSIKLASVKQSLKAWVSHQKRESCHTVGRYYTVDMLDVNEPLT